MHFSAKDFATFRLYAWYVTEQREKELSRRPWNSLEIIGEEALDFWTIVSELENFAAAAAAEGHEAA